MKTIATVAGKILLLSLLVLMLGGCRKEKVTELMIWGDADWSKGHATINRIFEQRHPGVKVVSSPDPAVGGSSQRLLSAIVGKVPPDLVVITTFTSDWVAKGAFMCLDEFVQRDRGEKYGIRPEEYYKAAWDAVTYQGKVYGIPQGTHVFALLYNKDLFRDAGFTDKNGEVVPPRDWDELFEYARKLTTRNKQGETTRLGFLAGHGWDGAYQYELLNGGHFISTDGKVCTANEAKVVEALAWLVSLSDCLGGRERIDDFKSMEMGGGMPSFLFTGRLAMKVGALDVYNDMSMYNVDMDLGAAPFPAPKGQPQRNLAHTWPIHIPVGAKHIGLAWEYIKWICSSEATEINTREHMNLLQSRGLRPQAPGTSSNRLINQMIEEEFVKNNPNFSDDLKKVFHLYVQMAENSENMLPVTTPVGEKLMDELGRAFEQATYHRQTPYEALTVAQRNVQQELDRIVSADQLKKVNWWHPLLGFVSLSLAGIVGLWLKSRRRAPVRGGRNKELGAGLLCVSPWAVGFMVFTAGPILFSIVLSFTQYSVLHPARWIGLGNYMELFRRDPLFWKSLLNTTYMLAGLPLSIMVGLAIAMLLNVGMKRIAVYRTLFYLPSIVPVVAAAILWVWIFHPTNGLMNVLLRYFHIEGPRWLLSEHWAKPAIILMGLWGAGSGMIIWLAGLKGIPEQLYEAAKIDGAGWWVQFIHITLPMLSPYIFFNLIMGIIGTLQIFTQSLIMTKGGPLDSTLFYVYHLFNNAFMYFRMGYASAMAWILFLVILALTFIQLKLAKRWVYYEAIQSR